MTINMDDQLDIFYWLKGRADKIREETKNSNDSDLEKLYKEGKALALYEMAREIIEDGGKWLIELADINEQRRIQNFQYDMRTAVEKGIDS